MFVSRCRFILKTCGTTTPLQCIKLLLMLVQQYSGFDEVEKVFYSHKNFTKPEYQRNIYCDFRQEVSFLDNCFKSNGVTYCRTSGTDKDDHWYLYALYPELTIDGSNNNNNSNKALVTGNEVLKNMSKEPDQTIEVVMTALDPKVMSLFTKAKCTSPNEATKKSGIDKLIPLMHIDDYLFDPCGYSMNGIMANGSYMTIHVTPQPEYSYVSFETNVSLPSYKDLISHVLNIFHPDKFVVSVFANEKSAAFKAPSEVKKMTKIDGWNQITSDVCKLSNYEMSIAFYSKFPS